MTTQDGPKTAQDRPRHPQDTPKTAQDPSKTTLLYLTAGGSFPTGRSWGDLGATFKAVRFRIDFWIDFLIDFGSLQEVPGAPQEAPRPPQERPVGKLPPAVR